MALTLYFVPFTRSTRPRWLLEEIGAPHELVRLDPRKGDTKSERYLKINPLGHVPALVDGETVILESGAIVMHLADKFPDARLAPPLGSEERGEYFQWIMFTHATLEPAIQPLHDQRQGKHVEPATVAATKTRLHDVLSLIDGRLNGRMFCAGNVFSAADIVLSAAISWANMLGQAHQFPRLQTYASRHLNRPAAKRAREV